MSRLDSDFDVAVQLGGEALRDASQSNSSGRQLLQTVSAATRAHNHKLQRVSPIHTI